MAPKALTHQDPGHLRDAEEEAAFLSTDPRASLPLKRTLLFTGSFPRGKLPVTPRSFELS